MKDGGDSLAFLTLMDEDEKLVVAAGKRSLR